MADQASVTIDLPWPPTANRYWRNVNGRMVLSRDGRRYREAVDGLVWKQFCESGPVGFGESHLELTIEAYPPDRRRRDLDNLLKPLLDALQHAGLFADDSQIVSLQIRRRCVAAYGLVRVCLTAISHDENVF
ncbi:MAG: RusA family crossover junction endodeoxyribonuclease [Thermogutta sp.]|uniref:RusA family crossover junction endodeoxyribonuclease n=1 Tax=Thermogutta sp. TaxID=1962930 RepID=UPI0019B9E3A2|nr:RusA family crossover junction endodeoxyribonuclease [Thermogutta sp.]MBC7351925.1 RusA family crossover junction endodeoxyribonuclease [Thermogutta sp.]